jgi:hypothetical protein
LDSSGRYQQVCRLDMSLQRARVGVQHCHRRISFQHQDRQRQTYHFRTTFRY